MVLHGVNISSVIPVGDKDFEMIFAVNVMRILFVIFPLNRFLLPQNGKNNPFRQKMSFLT